MVLIPEVQPARPWQQILHNQRGFVLERAIQRGTVNVVICRFRYRMEALAASQPEAAPGGDPGLPSAGRRDRPDLPG